MTSLLERLRELDESAGKAPWVRPGDVTALGGALMTRADWDLAYEARNALPAVVTALETLNAVGKWLAASDAPLPVIQGVEAALAPFVSEATQ